MAKRKITWEMSGEMLAEEVASDRKLYESIMTDVMPYIKDHVATGNDRSKAIATRKTAVLILLYLTREYENYTAIHQGAVWHAAQERVDYFIEELKLGNL